MKITYNLDEFVMMYQAANRKEKETVILAAFGSMTFVLQSELKIPGNERYVVDLSAKDVEKIIRSLEETQANE